MTSTDTAARVRATDRLVELATAYGWSTERVAGPLRLRFRRGVVAVVVDLTPRGTVSYADRSHQLDDDALRVFTETLHARDKGKRAAAERWLTLPAADDSRRVETIERGEGTGPDAVDVPERVEQLAAERRVDQLAADRTTAAEAGAEVIPVDVTSTRWSGGERRPSRLAVAINARVGMQYRGAWFRLAGIYVHTDGHYTAELVRQRAEGGDFRRGGRLDAGRTLLAVHGPHLHLRIVATLAALDAPVPVVLAADDPLDGCEDCATPGDFTATGGLCPDCLAVDLDADDAPAAEQADDVVVVDPAAGVAGCEHGAAWSSDCDVCSAERAAAREAMAAEQLREQQAAELAELAPTLAAALAAVELPYGDDAQVLTDAIRTTLGNVLADAERAAEARRERARQVVELRAEAEQYATRARATIAEVQRERDDAIREVARLRGQLAEARAEYDRQQATLGQAPRRSPRALDRARMAAVLTEHQLPADAPRGRLSRALRRAGVTLERTAPGSNRWAAVEQSEGGTLITYGVLTVDADGVEQMRAGALGHARVVADAELVTYCSRVWHAFTEGRGNAAPTRNAIAAEVYAEVDAERDDD